MRLSVGLGFVLVILVGACEKDSDKPEAIQVALSDNGEALEKVSVDRFSAEAGRLMVRSATNGLPASNAPIDFDQAPFITTGLSADGQIVQYYNFDVQSLKPAPIYVLFREGSSSPVEGQMNIIDSIPGEAGYNDFWNVVKVIVPNDYVANSIRSLESLEAAKYPQEKTTILVNCPVVPEGSTASKRLSGEATSLTQGWYKNKVVFYFNFGESDLATTADGLVPTSPIFVTFNINPDQPDGGPASGFVTAEGTTQTHNVLATLPGNEGYSPLWSVSVFDNAIFDSVSSLASIPADKILARGVANVNCPVVKFGL